MSKFQRIKNIFVSLLMILAAAVMFIWPENGYYIALFILTLGLLLNGVRTLIYYFSMARHMVGGGVIFIKGVIVTDLALLTFSLSDVPQRYVMIYLLVYYVFSGVIDILRAMESRKLEAPHWKLKVLKGVVSIIIAVVGMVFSSSVKIVVMIFCIGLIYLAVTRIISTFRPNAIVFISN